MNRPAPRRLADQVLATGPLRSAPTRDRPARARARAARVHHADPAMGAQRRRRAADRDPEHALARPLDQRLDDGRAADRRGDPAPAPAGRRSGRTAGAAARRQLDGERRLHHPRPAAGRRDPASRPGRPLRASGTAKPAAAASRSCSRLSRASAASRPVGPATTAGPSGPEGAVAQPDRVIVQRQHGPGPSSGRAPRVRPRRPSASSSGGVT